MAHLHEKQPNMRIHADSSAVKGWKEIFSKEPRMRYSKRMSIIEQGEHTNHLYYIASGLVEYTYTNADGVENLIEVIGPRNIVGMQPFFEKAAATGSFIALTEVVAYSLHEDQVYANIKRDNSLAIEFIVELCKIANGLVTQLFSHTKRVDDRIKELICALCEMDMSEKRASGQIFISLSQHELARITRTTRVTTTKVLGGLKKMGFLDIVYGGIIVKDYERLKKSIVAKNT